MLYSLYIKNLAIIDEVFVTFEDGLNIITGETGSGKTLIIKSIQLLLQSKFAADGFFGAKVWIPNHTHVSGALP